MCDHIIKVGVGVYNPGVLAHGPTHIEWTRTRYPAVEKSEARFIIR